LVGLIITELNGNEGNTFVLQHDNRSLDHENWATQLSVMRQLTRRLKHFNY